MHTYIYIYIHMYVHMYVYTHHRLATTVTKIPHARTHQCTDRQDTLSKISRQEEKAVFFVMRFQGTE